MRFQVMQPDNPLLRAEISYQRHTMPRWLQWFDRFGVIVLALVTSLILFFLPMKDDLYGQGWPLNFSPTILFLLWVAQVVIVIRCVTAGVHVMQHHRAWTQWDLVVLTGITRKQILIGKFWAALYQLRGWMVAFGIINVAAAALLSTNLAVYCYRTPLEWMRGEIHYYSSPDILSTQHALQLQAMYCPHPRTTTEIIVIISYTAAVSILGIMVSTAAGLAGGVLSNRVVGFIAAILCRFAPIVVFTFFPDYPSATGSITARWYEYTWFALADGGSTGILRSAAIWYRSSGLSMDIQPSLRAFWAAIILFTVYLLFVFIVSMILLRRQGVLSALSK